MIILRPVGEFFGGPSSPTSGTNFGILVSIEPGRGPIALATRAELSIWWSARRRTHFPHPSFQNFARKNLIKMRVNQGLKGVSDLFIFTIAPISAILREVPLLHNIGKQFSIGAVRNT